MAYDAELAQRIREQVAAEDAVTEMRMFGGLAFLVDGHMAVAATGRGGLMLRVDPVDTETLLDDRVSRVVMRGREMAGWLDIAPTAVRADEDLARYVRIGVAHARTLTPKPPRT